MTTLASKSLRNAAASQAVAGLDLGTKLMGWQCPTLEASLTPRTVIRQVKLQDAVALLGFANKEKVAAFIIGLPVNMDISEGPRSGDPRLRAQHG